MTAPEVARPLIGWVEASCSGEALADSVRSELVTVDRVQLGGSDPDFVVRLSGEPGLPPAGRSGPPLGVWRLEADGRPAAELAAACRAVLSRGATWIEARLVAEGARVRDGASDGGHGAGRTVLREGRLPVVPYSTRRTERRAAEDLARWPALACRGLLATGCLEGPRSPPPDGDPAACGGVPLTVPPEPPPEPAPSRLALLPRLVTRWIQRSWRTLFRHDHWAVGIVEQRPEALLGKSLTQVTWRELPRRGVFRADPFGMEVDGDTWVLYEELDYRDGRGRIVAERWGEDGETLERAVVFDAEVHLSYPYLFADDGEIYCIPEARQSGRVTLYRASDFPNAWEREAVLLEGEAALDSTVFRHGGRWWLFAADDNRGPRYVLNAWHAEALPGPWRPHAHNPVKVDVLSARPGGRPFRHGGELYRPAQSGADRYGEALVLNRIEQLTPERFAERPVRRIEPDPDAPRPDGLHTLSRLGDGRCLVDGNCTKFSSHEFLRRLRALFGF